MILTPNHNFVIYYYQSCVSVHERERERKKNRLEAALFLFFSMECIVIVWAFSHTSFVVGKYDFNCCITFYYFLIAGHSHYFQFPKLHPQSFITARPWISLHINFCLGLQLFPQGWFSQAGLQDTLKGLGAACRRVPQKVQSHSWHTRHTLLAHPLRR